MIILISCIIGIGVAGFLTLWIEPAVDDQGE